MREGDRIDVLVATSGARPQYRTGTVTSVYGPHITGDCERATVRLDGQATELWGVRADCTRAVVAELGRA